MRTIASALSSCAPSLPSVRVRSLSLRSLAEAALEFSALEDEWEFLRVVVEKAPRLLGVDRAGFWRYDEGSAVMRGTFGIGEKGEVRDEQEAVLRLHPGSEDFSTPGIRDSILELVDESKTAKKPAHRRFDGDLGDHEGCRVGAGYKLVVAVWGGGEVVGFLFLDNLFSGEDFSEQQVDMAHLYAAEIGQNLERLFVLRELRSNAERLERQRSISRAITDSIDEVVFARDLEGRYLFANASWKKLNPASGRWPITGLTLEDIFPPELVEERRERDREVLRAKGVYRVVRDQFFGVDDQRVECCGYPVSDDSGKPFAVAYVLRNVTEEERIRDEMREQKMIAESALREKADFIAVMNHELRTPLNAIIGPAQILAESDIDDEQMEMVGIIEDSARHLLDLVNGILDIARIDANRSHAESELYELRPALEKRLGPLRLLAKGKGLEFSVCVDQRVPVHLRTDEKMVASILVNLVGNAIKFTDDGGVTVRVQLLDEGLRFEVEDTGIGIKPEDFERLFREFEQLEGGRSSRSRGSGLGLSICKRLAGLLGGSLSVESEKGGGSIFRLDLPSAVLPH